MNAPEPHLAATPLLPALINMIDIYASHSNPRKRFSKEAHAGIDRYTARLVEEGKLYGPNEQSSPAAEGSPRAA